MHPLTPDDVQRALDATGLGLKIIHLELSAATAPLAAQALQTELGSIIKSLLFMVEAQAVLVLTAGDQKVHEGKLATRFAAPRKKVRIATAEECIAIVGYAPGGVPPVGHRRDDFPILIDQTLARFPLLYGAAGAAETVFPITYEQLQAVTGGTPADVVKEATA
jgi:prolyl-tRNA editing enzyme YbaK/EbsC (Cys-tRNA(Pro) deacylase)